MPEPHSTDDPPPGNDDPPEAGRPDAFEHEIGRKERRRLAARRQGERDVTFWLGMFGLVGWSVALPTVLAIALGVWIDRRFPSPYSWTLMLLFAGVVVGCLNAWFWIRREGGDD